MIKGNKILNKLKENGRKKWLIGIFSMFKMFNKIVIIIKINKFIYVFYILFMIKFYKDIHFNIILEKRKIKKSSFEDIFILERKKKNPFNSINYNRNTKIF